MKYIALLDDNNYVTGVCAVLPDALPTQTPYAELDQAMYDEIRHRRTGAFVVDGAVVLRPAPPTIYHKWDYAARQWVLDLFSQLTQETQDVRAKRDQLLAESDWTDTLSAQGRLGTPLYYRWQEYRQALRDITKQPGFPLDIVWPTPP